MSLQPRREPGDVRKDLQALIANADAPGFIAKCEAIKAEITDLLFTDRVVDAKRILEAYSNVLHDFESKNPEFTLEILPILPANTHGTLKLFGINDKIDAYLFAYKVDMVSICQVADDAFFYLIQWAVRNKDADLVEQVVVGIAQYLHAHHENQYKLFADTARHLLWALFEDGNVRMACTPATDEAMACLLRQQPQTKLQEYYLLSLAQAGMTKTLMRGLELPYFEAYYPKDEESHQILSDALPKQLTARELHWVHRSLALRGIAERILFDESVNMDHYIDSLENSYIGRSSFNELRFENLRQLTHSLDEHVVKDLSKRKRVITLLNAICEDEVNRIGQELTPEVVREALVNVDVPENLLKHVKMLKGIVLEDALGL
jgi:hypothetical protein